MKALCIFITLALVSCSTPQIALDGANWTEKQELPVKGRNGTRIKQKITFGDFKTLSVKRSWTRGSSSFDGWAWGRPGYDDYARIIGTEYEQKKQSIRFELTDGQANESSVLCVSHVKNENLVIGRNPNSLLNIAMDIMSIEEVSENTFWVKIYLKNDPQPWEMIIDNEASQSDNKTYKGVATQSKNNYYTIHPVYKMTMKDGKTYTMTIGSIGYEIRNKEGKTLAAVSFLNNGMVYLSPMQPDERFLVGNICTALLLQDVI